MEKFIKKEEAVMVKVNKKLKQLENKTILIWKIAIASALSWEVAKLAGSDHPYLAPLSVILCLQTTVIQSIQYSYHRMVGTVIGIIVTMFAAPYIGVNGWMIGLLILIGCFITKWLKRDESALHQVALTILLVFVMEHRSGDYFIDRFRDTLIGAIIAVMVHMLFYPPNFTKQASQSLYNFGRHLVLNLTKISDWIRFGMKKNEGHAIQKDINTLLQELHQTKTLLKAASDSLMYNPFGKSSKKKIQHFQQRLDVLTLGYTYLSSVIETMIAWSAEETIPNIQQIQWADQFKALIPFFGETEKKAGRQVENIIIDVPMELQKQQYFISLFNQTSQLVKRLNKTAGNFEKK
jgi:uncharacterized membrane protein YgaE (UPF0421/DUF939 family)